MPITRIMQSYNIMTKYTNYLKKFWSYKQAYKYFKQLNLTLNISSTCLVVTGTVAGGFTLNSVILRTISGVGLLLKTFSEIKDCKKKIEMCKFVHTTSEKVLVDLRASIRGAEFNQIFWIIDLCPLVDKFEKKYDKQFTPE